MEQDHKKELWTRLCGMGTRIQMKKNQYFSSVNNQENTAYCLVSGVCALVRFTQNGDEVIYHYFKEKDIIGGVPFFLSHNRSVPVFSMYQFCSLYTKTDCELYRIPFSLIEQEIRQCPELGYWISECISRHFMAVISHMHAAKEDFTAIRLCRTLLELADEKDGRYQLQKYFTYTELAGYLAVHPVTISKIMLNLKKMGVIEKDGRIIVLCDLPKLNRLIAHPEEIHLS